jgi:hypothetical protein
MLKEKLDGVLFMAIKFAKTNEKISEEELVEFEKLLKVRLPEDYRLFLLETNGGVPSEEYMCFDFLKREDCIDTMMIRCFYGFTQDIWDLAQLKYMNQKGLDGSPLTLEDCLIFANLLAGTYQVGTSLKEEKFGEVYLWNNHEPYYEDAWLIANNFTEFLGLLYPYSELIDRIEAEEE